MLNPVSIYAAGAYTATAGEEPSSLRTLVKQICGAGKRRIDRTTQLALLGACQCARRIDPPERTGIYLSSVYNSLNNSREILYDMFGYGEAPGPFKFINTVGSTTCFHLSQHFGFQGNSIALAQADFPVQSCVELAGADLEAGQVCAAMIGVTSEVGYPIHVHRERVGIDADRPVAEGSYWLLLGDDMPHRTPVARITERRAFTDEQSLGGWLDSQFSNTPVQPAFGSLVTEPMQQRLLNRLKGATAPRRAERDPFYEFPAAVVIHDFIHDRSSGDDALLYIDTSPNARWHVMLIERTSHQDK